MSKWLNRARAEISKTATQATAKTAETGFDSFGSKTVPMPPSYCQNPSLEVLTVLAVGNPGVLEKKEGQKPSFEPSGAAPDLGDYHERSGILESDCGLSRAEAETAAARELGFDSPGELFTATINGWRAEILAQPARRSADVAKLASASLEFLASEFVTTALALGWSDVDLLGILPGDTAAAKRRGDVSGLVPGIAWARWHGARILCVERDHAVITNDRGAELRHYRPRPEAGLAKMWWRDDISIQREKYCA